jgi:hypothetical protein
MLRGLRPARATAARRLATHASFGTGPRLLQVIDCHAGGEPARVVVGGLPAVAGADMSAKRATFMRELDSYRKLLLQEPRGYPCQNADFVLPSTRADAAYGVVIAEQGFIYPMMSGHNIICVATALLESGMVPMCEPVTEFGLDVPAGLVRIHAECRGGKAERITIHNEPAFCRPRDMDVTVNVPTLGDVKVDIACAPHASPTHSLLRWRVAPTVPVGRRRHATHAASAAARIARHCARGCACVRSVSVRSCACALA